MYLKDAEKVQIMPQMKQTFKNAFTLQIGKNEIIKMKNTGVITDRDLKIVQFLFNHRFATANQVYEFLGEDKNKPNIKMRLEKLINYRVLNKFTLSEFPMDEVPEDSYQIYCLDLGGLFLMASYTKEDTSDWFTTINMKGSEVIDKIITTVDIYLRMRDTLGDNLIAFKVEPIYTVNKKNIVPTFEIVIKDNAGAYKYFICEVVKNYDFPVYLREKALKYESLLTTNSWKKYFYDVTVAPPLLVFAEDDRLALDSAIAFSEMTEIESFRLSTEDRVKKTLYELGAFLKYDPQTKSLKEIKALTFNVKGE